MFCLLASGTVQADGVFDQFKDPDDGWFDGGDWLLNNAARVFGLRAGIDFAKGPEDSAVYLTIGSAWR